MSGAAEHDLIALAVVADDRGLHLEGTRALLYSHVAVDMLRKQLIHQVGEDLARSIVAQAGRHAGFNDAQLLLQERHFARVEDMLEMQYRFLTASGFGGFNVLELALDPPTRQAYVRVTCAASPEADSHRRLFGSATAPACWHLVGYSTGWTSAMTGLPLLTVESRCMARGDDHCELETMPYDDFVGPEASFWKRAFESTGKSLAQELTNKLATIQQQVATIGEQRSAIAELSAPILQVAENLLVVPIVGNINSVGARAITERLLPEVARRATRGVIVDVTGVEVMDGETAGHLLGMARAVMLLGARIIVTGISPAVAQTLVSEDVGFTSLVTRQTLQDGIRHFREQSVRGKTDA